MPIQWPASLPQRPLRDNFRIQHAPNLITSPTETGPGKTRPRQTHTPVKTPPELLMDDAQKSELQQFYENTTAFGSRPFQWTGLDDIIDGKPHEHKMTSPPIFSPYGVGWRVQLEIESW